MDIKSILSYVSIALGVLMFIGFLFGFLRNWKKSLIRFGLFVLSFVGALILSSKISSILMDKFVDGLVISAFGITYDFEEIAGDIAGDLLTEGSALTSFATALINIVIKLVAFVIVFIALLIVTLVIYWIISIIMSAKAKKKAVGKVKAKGWQRLIGGGIGIFASFILFVGLFTPIFGVMNVCDHFLVEDNKSSASAYNASLVCGKFYTEDEKIGTVETYLQKYADIKDEYNKSFAGIVLKYSGSDFVGRTTFSNLTTAKSGKLTLNLTKEIVNIVNVYNAYKDNFIENKFDITTQNTVDGIKDIYNITKNSEVLRCIVTDIIPKAANKWSNGEKFLNMDFPAKGEFEDVALDLLNAFNTDDFNVMDKNILVLFDVVEVANENEVISTINNGGEIMDVLDNGTFVKDEILALSGSVQYRRVLPNIMNTMIKTAYKSALGEPGTKLDFEFSSEDVLEDAFWQNEAEQMQNIVSSLLGFINGEETDIINNLSSFGVVIDSSRKSQILSKPLKVVMTDYITDKVTDIDNGSKDIILTSIEDNWGEEEYSFENLFKTVQATAKAAKDIANADMSDIQNVVTLIVENEAVKDTIKEVVNSGILKDMLGDDPKTTVFAEMITEIVDMTTAETIDADMQAGQVIVDIIKNGSNPTVSIFAGEENAYAGDTIADQADTLVEVLTSSETIMTVAGSGEAQSSIQSFIGTMNTDDKTAIQEAIGRLENGTNKTTLQSLFGL